MKYPNFLDGEKPRHMTPKDLDDILDNSFIHFNEDIYLGGEKCVGLCVKYPDNVRKRATILLDPNYYCVDEGLVHEGAHVFYRGTQGPLNIDVPDGVENGPHDFVRKAMVKDEYLEVSRKHLFRALDEPKNHSVLLREGQKLSKETLSEVTNEKYRGIPLIDAFRDVLDNKEVLITEGVNFPENARWWAEKGAVAGYNNPLADELYVSLEFDPLPQILMHEALHEIYPMLHERHIKQLEDALKDPKNEVMKICRERVIDELGKLDI